jgi:hypothetical protein
MVGAVKWSQESSARGLYNISFVQDGDRQAILTCGADGKILLYETSLDAIPTEYKTK